jgi:hypothetical protein
MGRRTIKPAEKPIKAVLAEFLADQRQRLKPKTLSRYESIIELFEASMDGYAYQYLDEDESALWDDLYNANGPEHREFCEIFGPEKIPQNVGEFLGYFMPHKVICGQDLLRAAGTVTKKLGKWLADKGYVNSDSADRMTDRGARASKDLPAAETLSQMLAAHADATTAPVSEQVEGYFEVRAVGDASLALEEITGAGKMTVSVPRPAARACRPGWTISGRIGKAARGWRLVEVWNVYA